MRSSTSVWSAICGIHFGETKAVASIARRPASARRSISSSFTAVGTSPFSFCSPSRGPTSTMRTLSGSVPMKECYRMPCLLKTSASFSPRASASRVAFSPATLASAAATT